ncbi:MAG: NADH-quinone oxidoreductase subunit N [Gemmatimonadaceae bacterium]|nr:NADH-quinone oxidoreductase subunit N [Gemmatimonadaceae bacterium]NUR20163.1 NADH-quinone oxidoreductase subunit N [Gemmatimonadaceae bacterium]
MNFMTHLDLSFPAQLSLALLPDLLLMGGAMILLLWAAWRPESARHQRSVGAACLGLIVLTTIAIGWFMYRHVTATPGPIAVDRFRWIADLVLLLGTAGTIALSMDYNEREGIFAPESHVLILLATSGMMLLAAARDLMIVFLGIETMSVATYVLAGMNRRSPRSAEAAMKYFLLGAFSTAFLLYGMALVYGATGATNLSVIGDRVMRFGLTTSPLLLTGIALMLVGFGFKVAAAPFHMWAPDVYEGAPTPITGYMAAAVKAAAFAAFLRIWYEAFTPVYASWHNAVWWLAAVTMAVGNIIALRQRDLKRLLAYSSIAHAGYLLVALTVNSPAGSEAFLFYAFVYTIATMGSFAVVVALGDPGERSLNVDDYAGLWTVRPWLAVAMAVFMLALLGFPVFGGAGFFAKWYVIRAALQAPSPHWKLAVILVLTSVISAGYYLYVVMVMFMRPRVASAAIPARSRGLTGFVIAASAVLLIVLGFFPERLVRLTEGSAPYGALTVPATSSAVPLPSLPPARR